MRLKNKLEVDSTLKVGALPTASTSNFSVLFENDGLVSKRSVGNIVNHNTNEFIQGISNSFPSIFNYNNSTTPSDSNLVVSLKNQLAGTVFAAPETLNGTPSFRKLADVDLDQTTVAFQDDIPTSSDYIQNLSLGTSAGQIDISNGTGVSLYDLSRINLADFNDVSGIKTGGFTTFFNTTGSLGYPNAAGQGIMSLRSGTTQGSFALWANNSDSDDKLYLNVGSSIGWNGWKSIATTDDIPTNYITTNTNQTGLSGNKTTNGSWTWTGNNAVPITLIRGANVSIKFQNTNDEGYHVGLRDKDTFAIGRGQGIGNMSTAHTSFWLDIDSGLVTSKGGFNKYGKTDASVLLAGGGDRPVSDFALGGQDYLSTTIPNSGASTLFSGDMNDPSQLPAGNYTQAISGSASNKPTGIGTVRSLISFGARNSTDSQFRSFIAIGSGGMAFYNEMIGTWLNVWNSANLINVSQLNNDAGYITSSSLPTVNNGQLTLSTGTGLSGSATFTANQSGSSTFSVAVASTHKLPTTAEWNALPTTNTITRLRGTSSGAFTSGDLTLLAGANTTITQSGANITIASTNTNTTYSAGTGLSLSGTTFSVNYGTSAGTSAQGNDVRINNGQTAFGWGNHALVGYLTSVPDSFVTKNNISSSALSTTVIDFDATGNGASILYAGASSANRPNVSGTAGGLLMRGNHATVGEFQLYLARGENDALLYRNQSGVWNRAASRAWVNSQGYLTSVDLSGYATETWVNTQLAGYVPTSRTLTAGNGLSGGGNLTANRTITLGTPSAITLSSTNSVTTSSHTHEFAPGGTTAQYIRGDGSLATYVDTTYTAGSGLTLSGTTFSLPVTVSGTGTYVQSVTQTATGITVTLGTPPNTNTTYSAGTVALLTAGTNQTNRVWRADHLNQGIKALTYNPDNLTFGSGLNYNTSTGVLTASSDSIFAYSPQGGLYTIDWSSNALGQYSLAIGHASNATAQNATAVGSAVFTGGFGSTNVGFSSNVNKSLAGNFGTYNTNNHRESFTYGLGLQSASTWQTVIGRYNKPIGAGDIDDWTDIRNPIFVLGVGQDEMNRKNAVSAFGDGRLDYEFDRDDTYWTDNTLPDIRWINENVGGGGGNSIPFVNEGELIEEEDILISGLSVKGYDVTSGTNPFGLNSIYVSNLDYASGEYISVDTANVYNRIVVSTSNGGRPAVSNGTISLDNNISGNDVSQITSMLSNRRMLLCIVLINDGVEYNIAEINLLGTEEIVGITTSDPTLKIVKVGSFYQKEGRLFIDVDPKII